MDKYLSTSSIFKSSYGLYKYFLTSYTYKMLSVLMNWCKHSKINQLITKYLQRSPSLKYSVTYRICSKVFSSVDRLWDKLYGFALITGNTSHVISFIRKTFCTNSSSIAYSIFILFFSCGFGVTSILSGNFNNIKAILLVLGLLVSILLLVDKSKWAACRQNSLFWRIILYVLD